VKRDDNKFKIIYPGSLNWHQGIDIAINAINRIKDKIPTAELHVYGEGGEKTHLLEQIKRCGLEDRVFLHDKVPTNKIPDLIARSDVGIVPKRADSFGNEAFSTKILEFMAMGLPVIVSNTKIDLYYFHPTLVQFFNSGDDQDLAQKILKFYSSPHLRKFLVKNGLSYINKNNWNVKNKLYFHVIKSLFD
jgi:glycosyltransferase involved in cell wall biosynthesis